MLPKLACLILIAAIGFCPSRSAHAQTTDGFPALPEPTREFRGVWVATVANIDWPTKPGLSTQEQKNEALKILDHCVEVGLNAIVLQVRTSCDALYASELEPWSYYLTGKQGQPPEPFYDPLEFWVDQAHLRGLELHAWFNPYRARNSGQKYTESSDHISRTNPELVKRYGNEKTSYLWLDPGEPKSREHSLRVFLDVVERYDVDGIHIDDYFYPYPIDELPFPDDPAWENYTRSGGALARDDWRRDQMNQFIQSLYQKIKATKPHVKFGISPFGIWKPGYPASVQGFNQFAKLYADAKLWLNEGWCDYYSPQLYWPIHAKEQSFPALLQWWIGENTKNRFIAPGIFTSRIGDKNRPFTVEQIEDQVFLARTLQGSSGTIHFSMKAIMENREGLSDRLQSNTYLTPALTPETPWLQVEKVAKPVVSQVRKASATQPANVVWQVANPHAARRWYVQRLINGRWKSSIHGPATLSIELDSQQDSESKVRAIAVAGVDGASQLGPSCVIAIE